MKNKKLSLALLSSTFFVAVGAMESNTITIMKKKEEATNELISLGIGAMSGVVFNSFASASAQNANIGGLSCATLFYMVAKSAKTMDEGKLFGKKLAYLLIGYGCSAAATRTFISMARNNKNQ